jgi:hypothetical protein
MSTITLHDGKRLDAELDAELDALLDTLEDRRRAPRVPVELACQCVDGAFVLLGDRIVDVSRDGVLLRSVESAKIGELVVLSFRIPGSAHWIDADARVVRHLTGMQPGAPGLGLELIDLGPFERELLAGTLERLRAPRRRRPRTSVPRSRGDRVERRPVIAVRGDSH